MKNYKDKNDIILSYNIWDDTYIILNIFDDIEKYKPNILIIEAAEEWQTALDVYDKNYYTKLEKKLIKYNIKCYIILGCKHINDVHEPRMKNSEIIYWPIFWLYRTNHFLNIKALNEKIDKVYLSFNHNPHEHRCLLMDKLYQNNLLDYGYVSWKYPTVKYNWKHWKPKKLYVSEEYFNEKGSFDTIPIEYFKAFVHIITESTINTLLLSEKTFTCILLEQPFIILGAPGSHKLLTDHGFDLYDEIFDYSFDSNEDINYRVDNIIKNINNIKDKDLNELKKKIKNKIIKNKNNAIDIIKNKKYVPDIIKKYKTYEKIL
jgi:hypothetical protein